MGNNKHDKGTGVEGTSINQAPEESVQGAMYKEADYVPFMCGIFIAAGLVALPFTYGFAMKLGYLQSLPWSMASCVVFFIAFRRNGTLSWHRLVPAVAAIAIVGTVYSQSTGRPAFAAGGFLGFLLIFACGYVGIGIGRLARGQAVWGKESAYVVVSTCGAALVAAIATVLANKWARSLPRTRDGIQPEEIPIWTVIVFVASVVVLVAVASAAAPSRILNSPRMQWLRRLSGTEKTWGMRLIFAIFAIIGIAVVAMLVAIARG